MLTLFTMGWNQFRSKFWSKFWSKNISYFCLLIFCFNIALLITQTVSVWVLQFVGNRMQINFQKCACRCFWVLNSTVWVIPMNKCFKIFSSHKQKEKECCFWIFVNPVYLPCMYWKQFRNLSCIYYSLLPSNACSIFSVTKE